MRLSYPSLTSAHPHDDHCSSFSFQGFAGEQGQHSYSSRLFRLWRYADTELMQPSPDVLTPVPFSLLSTQSCQSANLHALPNSLRCLQTADCWWPFRVKTATLGVVRFTGTNHGARSFEYPSAACMSYQLFMHGSLQHTKTCPLRRRI